MMDPFRNNMATQFGRFRILFRKSFIENVYINILKNIFFCNSFYLIIFLKHLRCFFTNAYGVRICSACGGNSRRHFGRTMCLHTKDTSTGQPTAGRSKLPSAAGVFRITARTDRKGYCPGMKRRLCVAGCVHQDQSQ